VFFHESDIIVVTFSEYFELPILAHVFSDVIEDLS